MGVDKEGVVLQLTGAAMACWVKGLLVLGLITALARVGLAWVVVETGSGLLLEVDKDMGLVTAGFVVEMEVLCMWTNVDKLLINF